MDGETYYFTFGSNHVHPDTDESLGNSYVELQGTWASTRAVMFDHFGRRWSMQYDSADEAGIERFGLTRIDLPKRKHPIPTVGF